MSEKLDFYKMKNINVMEDLSVLTPMAWYEADDCADDCRDCSDCSKETNYQDNDED